MARGMAESSARCASAGLVAGFTGFILVENGWGGKCETGCESGATRNTEGFESVRRLSRGVAGLGRKTPARGPSFLRTSRRYEKRVSAWRATERPQYRRLPSL